MLEIAPEKVGHVIVRARELDAKVEAFRTVHARVDRSCLDVIDLTVPTHPVLPRAEGC